MPNWSKKFLPIIFLIIFVCFFLYRETFTKGFVPVPADTLVGSYFPWLDYKWGYRVGVPVKNPPISDIFSQFFIWKHQLIDIFRQGKWPLWNNNSLAGTPLLATYHSAAFFPANLFLFLPKFWGWSLFIASSTLVSMLGMYLFISRWIKSPSARLVSSVIFGLAGPMTTWAEFGTGVWAAAMLPFLLYLVDQIIIGGKIKLFPLISLFTAFLLFAGHVQLDTYAAILLPVYIIYQLFTAPIVNKSSLLTGFLFFGLLGVSLASIQIFPTFSFQNLSIRGEENYASSFNYGLTPFFEIIRFWAADFFGHPVTYNHFSPASYHEYSGFLSTLSLPFIFALLFEKKNKTVKFFLSVFFLSLFLLIKNPLSELIFSLPLPLFTYSSASRLLFITVFSSAVLVPSSIIYLNSSKFRHRLIFVSLVLITITIIAIFFVAPQYRLIASRNSILPVSLLIFLILLIKLKLKTNIVVFILLILFSFDLSRYFRKYNPQVPARLVFPETPVIKFIKDQPGIFRIARQRGSLLPPNTWEYFDLNSIEGYDPMRLLSYNRLFHLLENQPYLNKSSRYSELEDINPKYLDALNVKYFLTLKENKKLTEHGFRPVLKDGSVTILENPHVLPRAYFVGNLIQVSTEKDLIEKIEDPSFDPRSTAVIISSNFEQSKLPLGQVEDIKYQPNTVSLNVKLKDPGFLVLSDAYDPGWQVKLNDENIKIHQVNGGVKGVFLSAGEHKLVFNYLPQSFVFGKRISLVSLIVLIISLIYFKSK